jgi:hypothetical protein
VLTCGCMGGVGRLGIEVMLWISMRSWLSSVGVRQEVVCGGGCTGVLGGGAALAGGCCWLGGYACGGLGKCCTFVR